MNNPFDELSKGLAQSVTRRAALKKFGGGLAGVALAAFGLANKAEATAGVVVRGKPKPCNTNADCPKGKPYCFRDEYSGQGICVSLG